MSDTELRVVLVVTRHTLGWIENEETGMRKKEDWISHSALIKETGRSSHAISSAVGSCVLRGWIETRDREGNIIATSEERRRRRVYYRLGNIFTDKLKSTAKSKVDENLPHLTTKSTALNDSNLPQKVRNTKETLTKEIITKDYVAPQSGADINAMIKLFENVNPNYERLYPNKSQRAALERMAAKFGEEKLGSVIKALPQIIVLPYAPKVTTPVDLERDLGKLMAFYQQEKGRTKNSKFVFL